MMRRVQVRPVQWPLALDTELAAWKQLDMSFLSYDPHFVRASGQCITPTERLEIILSHHSLHVRASDLKLFIERCAPEALKENYRLIVDCIFSHRDRDQAWDLRSIRKGDYPQDSASVLRLLAPDGPIITLALRLMDDHNFLLEFPLDGLPFQLRQKLLQCEVPPFFVNKLAVAQGLGLQRNNIQHLLLNPFEYYVFCFGAINILGLNTGRSPDYLNGWAALQDTLYTNVLEEYLAYYFPCNGAGVPSHNFNYNAQQGNEAVFMANSLLRQQHTKPKIGLGVPRDVANLHYQESNLPKLFKPSVLQDQAGSTGTRDNLFLTKHPSAYKEVWRSETMLHIFMELWMSGYNESLDNVEAFTTASPILYGGLPSVEVVKSIRMLVRHMHYFINCVNTHALHPMEEIRRNSFPIFQRRLYTFLRYLFHHWPLDNSFRIVYETWLSYIQPWRYVFLERTMSNQVKEAADVPVDRRWFNFILDNILFYSKIFSQMLIRLGRVDLTATKNALMFYRLAKVLTTQESLRTMLQEIENSIKSYERQLLTATVPPPQSAQQTQRQLLFSTPMSPKGATGGGGFFGGGKLSPIAASPGGTSFGPPTYVPDYSSNTSVSRIAHVKQLMKDYESQSYVYEPIFSEANVKRVSNLLRLSAEARDYLFESSTKLTEGDPTVKSQIIQFFKNLWLETKTLNELAALNLTERNKAGNQLEYSRNQFAFFFDIPLRENRNQSNAPSAISSFRSNGSFLAAATSPFSNGYSLSNSHFDDSRSKVILPSGVLVDNDLVAYGNPDNALVRSNEFRPLVCALKYVAEFLNYVFDDKIDALYFQHGLAGRYMRAIVAEPVEYIHCDKKGPGLKKAIRVLRYLPPRINLRFLASFNCFVWIFILFVIGCMLDLGRGLSWMALLALYFIYLTFRATSEPINKLEELSQLRMLYFPVMPEENEVGVRSSLTSERRRSSQVRDQSARVEQTPTSPDNYIHRRRVRFEGCGDGNM